MSEKVVIAEKQDAFVVLDLKDEDGTRLLVSAINALYYTLYDDETNGIINARTSVLVNPAANPYSLRLTPTDNVIVTTTKAEELHRLEILYTYNSSRGNALSARDVIALCVRNLTKVT
jgi:hypothetical protein